MNYPLWTAIMLSGVSVCPFGIGTILRFLRGFHVRAKTGAWGYGRGLPRLIEQNGGRLQEVIMQIKWGQGRRSWAFWSDELFGRLSTEPPLGGHLHLTLELEQMGADQSTMCRYERSTSTYGQTHPRETESFSCSLFPWNSRVSGLG